MVSHQCDTIGLDFEAIKVMKVLVDELNISYCETGNSLTRPNDDLLRSEKENITPFLNYVSSGNKDDDALERENYQLLKRRAWSSSRCCQYSRLGLSVCQVSRFVFGKMERKL